MSLNNNNYLVDKEYYSLIDKCIVQNNGKPLNSWATYLSDETKEYMEEVWEECERLTDKHLSAISFLLAAHDRDYLHSKLKELPHDKVIISLIEMDVSGKSIIYDAVINKIIEEAYEEWR